MKPVIHSWKRPPSEALEGKMYARGKPKFHPFPTVTDVAAATFCPRAALNLLLHNRDPFRPPYRGRGTASVGKDYHELIARLKLGIIAGQISASGISGIKSMVFATTSEPRYVWPHVQHWINNHIGKVNKGDEIYFETTVASGPKFDVGGKRMPFYVRGKIDEIDLMRERLIERTTREKTNALNIRKDFQLWLLWRILCSISKDNLPKEWRGYDFESFDLVLETPNAEVPVKSNPRYENEALTAFTWIRAIAYDPQAWQSAYSASIHTCKPKSYHEGCELRGVCYYKPPKYPESRKEMKKALGRKYQPLLWDTIWNHDLEQYRLILVDKKDLEKMKKVSSAQVVGQPTYFTAPDGTQSVMINVKLANPSSIRGMSQKNAQVHTILFGTPHAGLRANARVIDKKGNMLRLDFGDLPLTTLPKQVLITTVIHDILIFEEKPTFIVKRVQSDAFAFSRRGTSDQQKAQDTCNVRLVEGIFGPTRMKRGKK